MVGGPDGADPGPEAKPMPGAGPGTELWSWSSEACEGGPPLKEPPWERPRPEKPSAPNSSTRGREREGGGGSLTVKQEDFFNGQQLQ